MPIIRLSGVSLAFGSHPLLDKINFQIQPGERVGLIGRNGEGKSTLINLIAGSVVADEGEVWRDPDVRISLLDQTPKYDQKDTVYEVVAQGLGDIGGLISEYHALSSGSLTGKSSLEQLGRLQDRLEANQGWSLQQRVDRVLSQLDLPGDTPVSELSGGWLRRVALARALVSEPGLLLLDEPTNHLDLETILWLEEHLLEFSGAVLMITHDRSFLQRLATRIIDLDRGQLISWPGDYSDYLRRKEAVLQEEEQRNAEFDKKLAKEEVWIRQGIKARRTRKEGRVRALQKLRNERAQRRERTGTARIELVTSEASGKRVIEVQDLRFSYASNMVVSDLSIDVLRGDRVGLIGPNGAGKTTLLKLLLKQLKPGSGTVKHGTRLEIAFFDQMREEIDPNQTLVDWVGDGSDFLEFQGQKKHVLSYLGDFLFSPEKARSPIRTLSGGERNRLMLAKLFRNPANLLVMDEPTNDLDIETLELLEELLINFQGSLLLVSHDRQFIDNIVTSTVVFEGEGRIREYVGGYTDWQRQRDSERAKHVEVAPKVSKSRKKSAGLKTKLSYKEQQELANLPVRIEELEARQSELNNTVAGSEFYQGDKQIITDTLKELESLDEELESNYARWDELEARKVKISEDG